ncbi:UNVERIFIED_CONTAM: hypothetical protein Slati_0994200 [Sesamum latifolium]|uniref:Reverse transcriptase domain-containing protein n=1 Tax=Sesamum latifolium TaxID=2727402 RepID=A0AAW2XR96_9LAMI
MWADHPEFLATVEEGWRLNVEGTAQFVLCRKLKALKSPLKAFNRLHYSHISVRAKEADLALQNAQLHLDSNPGDATVRASLGISGRRPSFLAEAERHFFYQKAKIHYMKMGDMNTKFFHDLVKRNVAKSSILAITKGDGSTITEAGDIGQEFVAYFTSLLGTEAPGPDGFSACFFKRAWNVVGNQVCLAVMDFFRSGRLLRQLNHCIIALVPKSEHSPTVADYRPISCCNVIYKAITKIISDRLAPALVQLIDRSQAAFVGGRSITDNIFLAQEMVRQYTRKRISPRCTINVDLRKAFDSCEKLKITHLLFADDLMLFSRGDLPSIHLLMECLQEFRDVSGLAVNTTKSSIFTAEAFGHRLFPAWDQIAKSISKWSAKSLSYAGRLELIRSVIQGVECYWLQIFPLPATVVEKIHRLCRNFLWNSRRAPVAWEEICHPKEEGGLGIRHIQSWNVALLARVLWNIHRKADTLWVQWINGVYLRGGSIWDWQPKKGDSPLLQRLADIRNRLVTEFGSIEAAIQFMEAWTNRKGLDTSKAYEYFRPKRTRQPWQEAIWKAFIPPKYSFVLWLGLRGRLATRDRLPFLHEEEACSLCINRRESAGHLFFECSFSDFVWSHIRHWVGISRRMSTLLSTVKWLKKEKTGSPVQNKVRRIALACTVHSLWRHRNEVIFEGKAPCPDGLVISIKISVYRLLLTLFPHGLIAH